MNISVFCKKYPQFVIILLLLIFLGCKGPQEEVSRGPVFYPEPPDPPKLQFLKAFSSEGDVGAAQASAFESFIVGEAEEEKIKKPYGIALHDSKFYICDTDLKQVIILDLANRTFGYMKKDKRMVNPVNIYIEPDGTKYITDPMSGAVFVLNNDNRILRILCRELKIAPADIYVRGQNCYVTDIARHQVVVFDKVSGKLVKRIGRKGSNPITDPPEYFAHISDLTLDVEGNIYVTDRLAANIKKFSPEGEFIRLFGGLGTNINLFGRPKGLSIDRDNRIWIVDAASEVAKIYNEKGQLLLFFGFPGDNPGNINLPSKIILDYDHVDLFQQYAVPGAKLEFLVIVANQFGRDKINVYGFGQFPAPGGQ
jgi:hypothetical protein